MVLQLNGGVPVFQVSQTARPMEFEAAPGGTHRPGRAGLRQELDKRLHLLLRHGGQRFIFGDQRVFAHNVVMLPASRLCRNLAVGQLSSPPNAGHTSRRERRCSSDPDCRGPAWRSSRSMRRSGRVSRSREPARLTRGEVASVGISITFSGERTRRGVRWESCREGWWRW